MHRRIVFVAALVVSLAAPTAPLAVGEGVDGFPTWAERVLHEWTNRARCDPQVEMTACGAACAEKACYAPVAPVAWSDGVGRAARFHADEMRLQGYFAHASACTVVSDVASRYPATCDGSAACACVGGVRACSPTCTQWYERLVLFNSMAAAETIASGFTDPNAAFYSWLYESFAWNVCGDTRNPNRQAILVTTGLAAIGTAMTGTYAVMEFGSTGATPGRVRSGAHYPRQGASIEAWTNWYDTAGGPAAAAVVVDGACTAMTLGRGSQTNGAWRAVLTGLETGCHRYYFAFKDSAGALVTYPTTGSLGIGDESCADFSTDRAALGAGCAALGACDPAPGGCEDGDPCTTDACEASGCTHVAAANGTACPDGNVCNGSETCQSGACAAGSALDCSDANPCTTDACNPATGCAHAAVANGTSCADPDSCDGAETCQSGACAPGTPLACDDGNACTVDTCAPATGCASAAAPATAECSDGLDCNGVERCDGAGACVPGAACEDPPPPSDTSSGCGCGAGSGASGLVLALLALAGAGPRARRRRA